LRHTSERTHKNTERKSLSFRLDFQKKNRIVKAETMKLLTIFAIVFIVVGITQTTSVSARPTVCVDKENVAFTNTFTTTKGKRDKQVNDLCNWVNKKPKRKERRCNKENKDMVSEHGSSRVMDICCESCSEYNDEPATDAEVESFECPATRADLLALNDDSNCVSSEFCNYEYVWQGCAKDEQQCAPIHECGCNDNKWECTANMLQACAPPDREAVIPEDQKPHVQGSECEEETAEEPFDCPATMTGLLALNGSNCVSSEICNYEYVWQGCAEDKQECSPITDCECVGNGGNESKWECTTNLLAACAEPSLRGVVSRQGSECGV
jgi:hypothetical protein